MKSGNGMALTVLGPRALVRHEGSRERIVRPAADVVETPEAFVLRVDVPGAAKDRVEIRVEDGILRITAPTDSGVPTNAVLHLNERSATSYLREFRIVDGVDTERIQAHLENGVLEIELPKAEATKRKEITIR